MDKEDDVQLIERILAGDSEAFTVLVRKHQKWVHALAWRRIGDFHHAEEITQDTFIRVYKHLPKLKDPRHFSGWLYVITNQLCNTWLKDNKSLIGSLEDVPVGDLHRTSYERYISEQQETEAREHRHELVKKLLQKLPESERTVLTLYYLGEMTTKEISKSLGVSVHTITSRLQRARNRLKQDEELVVQEALGSVCLSWGLAERIAEKVADIPLTPAPSGKPLLPWAALGISVVLVTLIMLGLSTQYLNRFQKPYSFDAHSEPTIEIVDVPVVLDSAAKQDVRNQVGQVSVALENEVNPDTQNSHTVSETPTEGIDVSRFSASQWTQTLFPQTGPVQDLFATSTGGLIAASPAGVYRLPAGATTWMPVKSLPVLKGDVRFPMAEHEGTTYIVATDEIFASTDGGETYQAFCRRPKGPPIDFLIVPQSRETRGFPSPKGSLAMYLALENRGVFRSTDAGAHWIPMNTGLTDKRIMDLATMGNTVFAGTNAGLYRLRQKVWERQSTVFSSAAIHCVAVVKNDLYVGTGTDFYPLPPRGATSTGDRNQVHVKRTAPKRIFRSTDIGVTWTEITPPHPAPFMRVPSGINISGAGDALLVTGTANFYSTDRGETWTRLADDQTALMVLSFLVVAVDERTFYKAGAAGLHRTVDGGQSWHPFMEGMVGTRLLNIVAFNNRLYAHIGNNIAESTDGGTSWKDVWREEPIVHLSPASKLFVADGVLYAIMPEAENVRILYFSVPRKTFIPLQGVPAFDKAVMNDEETRDPLTPLLRMMIDWTVMGAFTISDQTVYAEYKGQLLKWRPGDAEWKETGLATDTDNENYGGRLVSVSGKVLYVGQRDGKLFQSLDGGESWRDVTSSLPLVSFTRFNDIVFAGSRVYIATDQGVLSSESGTHWRVITDRTGARPVIDRLAIDHTRVYGAGETGVYLLSAARKWDEVAPGALGRVRSLVVSSNRNRLYVLTQESRMFHISLESEKYTLSH